MFGFQQPAAGNDGAQTFVPIASKSWKTVKLDGAQVGAVSNPIRKNQAGILIQVLDSFVADGPWRCDGSSNGTVGAQDGVNRWVTEADLTTSPHDSWILLTNTTTNRQLMILVSVAGAWLEVITLCSLSAAFAGGTAAVLPSAPDQYQVTPPVGADWLGTSVDEGTDNNPHFRAWCQYSTDGECTRVIWVYEKPAGAGLAITTAGLWKFETLNGAAPGVTNWQTYMADNGNSYVNPAQFWYLYRYNLQGRTIKTPVALENVNCVADQWGGNYLLDVYPKSPNNAAIVWSDPLALVVGNLANPHNGVCGWEWDHWWIGNPPNSGNNPPVVPCYDTADDRKFIFIDGNMFVWDGTVPPGSVGSVDHPATAFAGRGKL